MENKLKKIFLNHKGKLSDKWELYINEWDQIFSPYQNNDVNLFEIGVHNGGSLEIWTDYFKNAKQIVGCDINEGCRKLEFEDPRVSVIIGDVNTDSVKAALIALANNFDIIIDDGSHSSSDIIRSFAHYFKLLKPQGLYVIEDLHASYWDEFEGGLYDPYSAISFFKRLIDVTNFEHWRNDQSREDHLSPYCQYYNVAFSEFDLNMIHKIEFINSLCVIQKENPGENNLGRRFIVGSQEPVSQNWKKLDGSTIHDVPTKVKDTSNLDVFALISQNEVLRADIESLDRANQKFKSDTEEQKEKIHQLITKAASQENIIRHLEVELETLRQSEQGLIGALADQEETVNQLKVVIDTLRHDLEQLSSEKEQQSHLIEKYKSELNITKGEIEAYDLKLNEFDTLVQGQNRRIAELEEENLAYALKENWRLNKILGKFSKVFQQKGLLRDLFAYIKINRSGTFDKSYYLQTYPDVRRAKYDPVMHFIQHGWKEGRNPNKHFNTSSYLVFHPEIARSGKNPLVHFLKHRKQEAYFTNQFNFKNNQFNHIDLSANASRMVSIPYNANDPPQSPDIIIFPIIDWDFRFQRPQQLATRLAQAGHRVFYIQTTFRNGDGPMIKAIADKIFSVQLSSRDTSMGIYASFPDKSISDLESSIQLLKDHFLINAAIMMVDLPTWVKLANRLKQSFGWKLVYDCMDLHAGFSNSTLLTQRDERLLLHESDLVFTTSHYLYDHARQKNSHTLLVPNGTDFSFFHQACEPMDVEEIQDLPRPIIGYYGAIADWFDTDLVGELAADHPDWTFLLIGSTDLADLDPLAGLSNVHLLGEKPYSELPGFLSNFDVCIIPFKKVPLTQATNPVKLYEYLSAGKPVVATRLAEISHYQDHVRLAETKEEWSNAITETLAEEKSPEVLSMRFEFAQENTWEKRAKDVEREINRLFPKISIIIVSFDNLNYTRMCLDSIIKNTGYPNYEMIVVDNASQKDAVEYLKAFAARHTNVRLQLNKKNLGFAKANNQGFQKSSGDYVVFLNNDTIVTPGWLFRLLHYLQRNPKVGMVGPVTNDIGNEAKIDVNYTSLDDINAFSAYRAKDFSGESFKIDVLALYCCMTSRALFENVDGLDERYEIAFFEDDDLAMKVREKGLDLLCAEDVFIHHFHGASLNKLAEEDYQKLFEENKRKFEEKWGIVWQPHQYRGKP